MKIAAIVLIAGAPSLAFAQSAPVIASAGYSSPGPLQAAPGQVVTIFVRGVPPGADWRLRSGRAASLPLPNTMAGVSLEIIQGERTLYAPVFAVRQESECETAGAAEAPCLLTSILVQLPFDLAAGITLNEQRKVVYSPVAQVRIDVDGQPGRPFALQPLPDNGHVLTSCDASWDTHPESVCERHVYHADGSLADEKAPAKAGETVVVYAYGLGQTVAGGDAGVAAPAGAALTDLLGRPRVVAALETDFLNAQGSTPRMFLNTPVHAETLPIVFAGLVPGEVGLYQLNIRLPSTLSSYPCGGDVRSNAVLSVTTLQGTEIVPLCVQP